MAQYSDVSGTVGLQAGASTNNSQATNILKRKISYGTTNQVYSLSTTVSASAPSGVIPRRLEVTNTGRVPLFVLAGFETFSDDTSEVGATRYLHVMLSPNEIWIPPVKGLISTEAASTQFTGTTLSNVILTDDGLASGTKILYLDSDADLDHATSATMGSDATHTTLNTENGHSKYFRVGDLIRLENEICEVTATGTGADIANSTLTITRGAYGSDAATHADDVAIRLPFFNAYHDFDKYSVAQTDSQGRFKCFNMFGKGRATTAMQGIVPGSFGIKFYQPGYQELGLSGITSSTNSGLAASTAYAFDIQVDGGTNFDNLTFTTDSSNVNFGGTNGVIAKIQSALDTQFYTSGHLFEKKVNVAIVGGDIRFTSGSHLSTSAIAITAEDGGDASFLGTGRIPALGDIDKAVGAKLPDDVSYDSVTYATSSNPIFGYDDGQGRITGVCSGTINYETGSIDIVGAPPNAEFVYSVAHTSGFSGKLDTTKNGLVEILANNPNQKIEGQLEVRTF